MILDNRLSIQSAKLRVQYKTSILSLAPNFLYRYSLDVALSSKYMMKKTFRDGAFLSLIFS